MIIGEGIGYPPFVGRAHKEQHVPVRGAIVMWFAHPKAVDGHICPLKFPNFQLSYVRRQFS
jgi:hypothetical protein